MTARMHILCVVSPISFCSPYHTLNLDETFSCLSIFLAFLESMYYVYTCMALGVCVTPVGMALEELIGYV